MDFLLPRKLTSSTKPISFMSQTQQQIQEQVDGLVYKLKRRQLAGSYKVAIETAQLLMRLITMARWKNTDQLIELIRDAGRQLIAAQPREFASGNIVRRVLSLIRDESLEMEREKPDIDKNTAMMSSMFSLLSTTDTKNQQQHSISDAKERTQDLRSLVIQGIRDLMDEISAVHENIELMSIDLIHDNEVLLTPTPNSQTVLNFLLKARQKRKFTVLVTECFPNHTEDAHKFVKKLADAKIDTVLIPDSTVFAVMSRVGKVIIGARSVFVNGGCVSTSGVAAVTECAKEHRTPVFTVAGLYKLSPTYPFDNDSLIEVGNSGKVIDYSDQDLVGRCEVTNPLMDYIDPENIDIYITNVGGFSPNFIYRIVLDNYKSDDVNL
ncbi:hypothetical protein LJB42_002727 [Komagataella kurtzmanii]|nr:hypothetical protein LJB42_002727 [Komagataella kurtzmanii]